MRRITRHMLSIFCICALVAASSLSAFAARVGIAENSGRLELTMEDSFGLIRMEDAVPGDSASQTIQVKNRLGDRVGIGLSVSAPQGLTGEALAGQQALLNAVRTEVHLESPAGALTPLFDGVLADCTGVHSLGSLAAGQETNLVISVEIPVTVGNELQLLDGSIVWQLSAWVVEPGPGPSNDNSSGGSKDSDDDSSNGSSSSSCGDDSSKSSGGDRSDDGSHDRPGRWTDRRDTLGEGTGAGGGTHSADFTTIDDADVPLATLPLTEGIGGVGSVKRLPDTGDSTLLFPAMGLVLGAGLLILLTARPKRRKPQSK